MRINIITQPLFCNYGGILQNYALQKVLRDLGHEPLTLNRPTPKRGHAPIWKEIAYIGRNLIKKFKKEWPWPTLLNYKVNEIEHTLSYPQRQFISKHINKIDIEPPFTADKLKNYHADAYIVGSDQVWRPWCSPYMANCFFDFAKDEHIKRIAYAASFGTDKWEMDEGTTEEARFLAKRFKAISVREESGVGLCKKNLGVDARHMPDPTLLLTADDYITLTSDDDHPHDDYIAAYILDPNTSKHKEIKKLSKKLGLRVVNVGKVTKHGFDSIEYWLATIAHARHVITDSFHGTVFSLIFQRPVNILSNDMRGNARLESLLAMCGLDKNIRCIRPSEKISEQLRELRKSGIEFLHNNLNDA